MRAVQSHLQQRGNLFFSVRVLREAGETLRTYAVAPVPRRDGLVEITKAQPRGKPPKLLLFDPRRAIVWEPVVFKNGVKKK